MQGFAGGSAGANIPMSPGWATFDRVQGRKKNDLLSSQVWWGDNCARRVERQSSIAVCFISGTSYAIASKVPTIELSLTNHLNKRR